ncbi:MAG: outer membrane lipid asymmetry maintenance protein MlaD [Alphaproteobacteria bacterium]|nr:outer membrane lipid asymmetry maintenance protein MlaD [Alphaproteobacteria bacterium]
MRRSFIETIIGGLVIAVAGIFLFYAYQNSSFANKGGYEVKAQFLSIGGLTVGSDIRVGGVKVGSVSRLMLDQEDYLAIVTLSIDDKVKLPDDTEVTIVSDGLLGGRYVSLAPGASKTFVAAGGDLKNTKDVRTVEQILGEAIYVIANQASATDEQKK